MHVTSIGLDVHARTIAACAFDPFTGELTRRDFGTDAGEIAAWASGFDSPKCVYESGPTGWHLARELRSLGVDCAVAAVSRVQKPAADKRRKNDRRDAEFLARMLATHNIVEVPVPTEEVEAARDLSRALDDCREDLQRARQRLSKFLLRRGFVFDEANAAGQRSGGVDARLLEVGGRDRARGRGPQGARAVRHGRAVRREGQARARAGGLGPLPRAALGARRLGPAVREGHRRGHGAVPGRRGRQLQPVPLGAGLRELAGPHALGALQRRARGARRHHQGGQLRQQARPRGVGVALRVLLAQAQGGPSRRLAGDNPAGRRLRQEAHGALRRAARRRQEAVRRERRRGPRACVLGVGARLPRRGHDGLGRPRG